MKLSQLRELISELVSEELDDLDERNKENKAKKNAYHADLGKGSFKEPLKQGRNIGRSGPEDHLQGRQVRVKSEPTKPTQAQVAQSGNAEFNYNRDVKNRRTALKRDTRAGVQALGTAPAGPPTASSLNPVVPPQVQKAASKAAGGMVKFGKYYDATGKYLGKVQGGKWIDVSQDNNVGTLEEGKTKMIRLTDLLKENAERRVNLMKIQTIMEKLYPELTDAQSKKLMELCTEVHMMASQMNTIPYIRTESRLVEWTLLVTTFRSKVKELKEEVIKVCEDKKIDCTTVVKALDEALTY